MGVLQLEVGCGETIAGAVSQQLVKGHTRQMGSGCSYGLQDRVSKQLHPANTQNGCGSGCRPATPTGRNIQKLFSKGAITEVGSGEANQGFYFSLFLVLKKDGGRRLVINLKSLNEFVAPNHSRWRGYTR